jgi:hypothetical protein
MYNSENMKHMLSMKPFYHGIFSYEDYMLYGDFSKSKIPEYDEWDIKIKNRTTVQSPEELNLYNYRSDNFINNHDGTHILFAGCSYTWGVGLFEDERWSKIIYDKISKTNSVSGYFNLGLPGSSIIHQVVNMFKYFNKFGNPEIIFFNVPDLCRFYGYNKQNNKFVDSHYTGDALKITSLLSYQHYLMLDTYCKANQIKLFSFSWAYAEKAQDFLFEESTIENFKSFYKTEYNEIKSFVDNYKQKNINDTYSEIARDKNHLGTAYNHYWANFIYNKYLESS